MLLLIHAVIKLIRVSERGPWGQGAMFIVMGINAYRIKALFLDQGIILRHDYLRKYIQIYKINVEYPRALQNKRTRLFNELWFEEDD